MQRTAKTVSVGQGEGDRSQPSPLRRGAGEDVRVLVPCWTADVHVHFECLRHLERLSVATLKIIEAGLPLAGAAQAMALPVTVLEEEASFLEEIGLVSTDGSGLRKLSGLGARRLYAHDELEAFHAAKPTLVCDLANKHIVEDVWSEAPAGMTKIPALLTSRRLVREMQDEDGAQERLLSRVGEKLACVRGRTDEEGVAVELEPREAATSLWAPATLDLRDLSRLVQVGTSFTKDHGVTLGLPAACVTLRGRGSELRTLCVFFQTAELVHMEGVPAEPSAGDTVLGLPLAAMSDKVASRLQLGLAKARADLPGARIVEQGEKTVLVRLSRQALKDRLRLDEEEHG